MPRTQITPADFAAPAMEVEAEMDDAFAMDAPQGRYSKAVINQLVNTLRSAQGLMGVPEEALYPLFEEDVVMAFPPAFVRALAMLASAAEDYGQPGLIDLSNIKQDRDVALLAAKIDKLVKDEGFKAFLNEEAPSAEIDEVAETANDDEDAYLASRMS